VAGFPESVRLPKSGKVLQVDFEKRLGTGLGGKNVGVAVDF
jgi:hypothetical protein